MKKLILLVGVLVVVGCESNYESDIETRAFKRLEFMTKSFECLYYCNTRYSSEDCKQLCLRDIYEGEIAKELEN
jgi:hypothetical protein